MPTTSTVDPPQAPEPYPSGRGHYGWQPDRPDQRDLLYTAPFIQIASLPPAVDLREQCPAVLDQGPLGSCTANAIANAFSFDLIKQGKGRSFIPSRLFIYYNDRLAEGTVNADCGGAIRDSIKSIARQGVCSEARLPYNPSRFHKKPSTACYREARLHQAVTYMRLVQTINAMKTCLVAGYPFVFGLSVYESFEADKVAQSGHVNLPAPHEKMVGGHAVLAVGYDDRLQRLWIQNSWGTTWGQEGYFSLPYAYVRNADLACDFWTVRAVEA